MPTSADPPVTDADTGPRSAPPRRRRRRLPFWAEVPVLLALAVAIAVVVQGLLLRVYVVPSGSMETTLTGCFGCTNDRIAVDKVSRHVGPPAPGDIVVFRGPSAWNDNAEVSTSRSPDSVRQFLLDLSSYASLSSPDEKDFVKRVVAVGGQTVACCDRGRVTVDGHPLDEPYVHLEPGSPPQQSPFRPVHLDAGQMWVMGDNRNNSADSRAHGPITEDDLIGTARAVVWPLARWETLPRVDPGTR